MRLSILQVQCDLCPVVSGTYDMALLQLSDVVQELRYQGWFRARGSCQDLCPDCNAKRIAAELEDAEAAAEEKLARGARIGGAA